MQCPSQNCDVSKNSNLQAFSIPDILADKTSHFLRFDYPMKRVPKSPFSGCTSSRYQQQQQIVLRCPIKLFSQWRDCAEFFPKAMVVRFSKNNCPPELSRLQIIFKLNAKIYFPHIYFFVVKVFVVILKWTAIEKCWTLLELFKKIRIMVKL